VSWVPVVNRANAWAEKYFALEEAVAARPVIRVDGVDGDGYVGVKVVARKDSGAAFAQFYGSGVVLSDANALRIAYWIIETFGEPTASPEPEGRRA